MFIDIISSVITVAALVAAGFIVRDFRRNGRTGA
ncbi:hypothetical protein SAMN05444413_101330 [Roseivivax marinus]|jgi:hypothetical protein|nr:hypothetical protein SAMN05444413_101330 [Roseivivax marinus]